MRAVGERVDIPLFLEAFMLSPRPYEVTIYDRYFLGYDRPICYTTESQVNIEILAGQNKSSFYMVVYYKPLSLSV